MIGTLCSKSPCPLHKSSDGPTASSCIGIVRILYRFFACSRRMCRTLGIKDKDYYSVVDWIIINGICIMSPFVLTWGWIKYLQLPDCSDRRCRASFVGLSAPLVSVAMWLIMLVFAGIKGLNSPAPSIQRMIKTGISTAILGMLIGVAGRPRLILAIVASCIGAVWFWIGSTVP